MNVKHCNNFSCKTARSTSALSAILFLDVSFQCRMFPANKSPATVSLKITYCHTWRRPPQRDRSRPLWSACTASTMSLSLWEEKARTCRICSSVELIILRRVLYTVRQLSHILSYNPSPTSHSSSSVHQLIHTHSHADNDNFCFFLQSIQCPLLWSPSIMRWGKNLCMRWESKICNKYTE